MTENYLDGVETALQDLRLRPTPTTPHALYLALGDTIGILDDLAAVLHTLRRGYDQLPDTEHGPSVDTLGPAIDPAIVLSGLIRSLADSQAVLRTTTTTALSAAHGAAAGRL